MSTTQVAQLFQLHARPLEIAKDQVILELGEPSETFYYLEQGEVVVREELVTGQQTSLKFLHAGDCFGEIELFTTQAKNYEVKATQPGHLLALTKTELDHLMQEQFVITQYLIEQIIAKLSASSENLIRLSLMNTYDRCLVKLYEYFKSHELEQLTKQKLAQETNTTLRSVNRALQRFSANGWLSYTNKQFILVKPIAIANYLSKNWGIYFPD